MILHVCIEHEGNTVQVDHVLTEKELVEAYESPRDNVKKILKAMVKTVVHETFDK